jgi:DNA-binding NarL/FixJ family response regulator
MKEQIRVVIVEDHPGVRAGIRKLLTNAEDIVVVGEAANGLEALQLAQTHIPDVMLLDVELPLLRGDQVVRNIRDNQPAIKVLAVSSYNDRSYIQGMMDNGASGYITKEEAPELLLEAVYKIFEGRGKWVSPRAQKYTSQE